MKRFCIITLAIVCLGIHPLLHAEIRNGYEDTVKKAEKYLQNLKEIAFLEKNYNDIQQERLNKWEEFVFAKVAQLRKNRDKTQELIDMLREIDPLLYHEINSIKDSEGNDTHVYIKVVDEIGPGIFGVTNLKQSVDNPNVYTSEYGDYTVSVTLVYKFSRFPKAALRILVHELGHVRYQVPHLSDYCEYFNKVYQNQYFEGIRFGHYPNDLSHQSVIQTLEAFKSSWREYKREEKWMAKSKSQNTLATTR